MDPVDLWLFFPLGYLITILIETPVLVLGLSPQHPLSRRLFAGLWLTACTYPIVVLLLPLLLDSQEQRWVYLLVGETFAPVAECAIFWIAFGDKERVWSRSMCRDFAAIVVANVLSFAPFELYEHRYTIKEMIAPQATVTVVSLDGRRGIIHNRQSQSLSGARVETLMPWCSATTESAGACNRAAVVLYATARTPWRWLRRPKSTATRFGR